MASTVHRLQYAAFRTLEGVTGALPWPARRKLGAALGRVWHGVDIGHRSVGLANAQRAFPEWPQGTRERLVRSCFEHLGRTFAEFVGLRSVSRAALLERVRFEGTEELEAALARGRGAFLLTAHLGNWELLVPAISARGIRLAAIARRLSNPQVDEEVARLRGRYGAQLFAHRDAVRPVLRWLQQGGVVLLAMDQRPRPHEAVTSEFFGQRVATNAGLALLALRTGAPVVPTFGLRTARGHRVRFGPALDPPATGSRDRRVEEFTRRCDGIIEAAVRSHPEQWFWVHDRWKIPPGLAA